MIEQSSFVYAFSHSPAREKNTVWSRTRVLKKGKHARYCGSLTHFRPPPRMIDIHPQRRLTLQRTKGRKEATWAHIPSFPPPLPWVELLANVTLMLPRRVTAERTFRTKKHRKEGRMLKWNLKIQKSQRSNWRCNRTYLFHLFTCSSPVYVVLNFDLFLVILNVKTKAKSSAAARRSIMLWAQGQFHPLLDSSAFGRRTMNSTVTSPWNDFLFGA